MIELRSAAARYYLVECVGCVAIFDRDFADPNYPGVHPDSPGVVRFWRGRHWPRWARFGRWAHRVWWVPPWTMLRARLALRAFSRIGDE